MRSRSAVAVLAAAAAAIAAAPPVDAHDFWLEPSGFRVGPGAVVAVRLRVGERFEGDPVTRRPERIQRFALIAPGQEAPLEGPPGVDPAGIGQAPDRRGAAFAVYAGRPASITLESEKFERYLGEEGLERIAAERAARGRSGEPGREAYSRCAKALLYVGGSDEGFDLAAGCPFEIVLGESAPRGAGDPLAIELRFHGAPVAGVRVAILRRGDGRETAAARSDGQGRARFVLDRPGVWMVKAVHMNEAAEGSSADWESFWASLVLEVVDGRAEPER